MNINMALQHLASPDLIKRWYRRIEVAWWPPNLPAIMLRSQVCKLRRQLLKRILQLAIGHCQPLV
jgi:hypothetical protein